MRSHDSATRPLPISFSVFLCVSGPAYWRVGGGGVGVEPTY